MSESFFKQVYDDCKSMIEDMQVEPEELASPANRALREHTREQLELYVTGKAYGGYYGSEESARRNICDNSQEYARLLSDYRYENGENWDADATDDPELADMYARTQVFDSVWTDIINEYEAHFGVWEK